MNPTTLDEMEAKLREAHGTAFDGMYRESLAEYGVRRGALNALRNKETETTLNPALFVSSLVRTATRGEQKGKVTQVSFRVLQPDGSPSLVIAARDSLEWVKAKFPDVSGRLVPVSIGPVTKREDVLTGATLYFVIPQKTLLALVKDSGSLGLSLDVVPIATAIERQMAKPKTTRSDPFSVIYGSIRDARVFVDKETGQLSSVKATLEDMNGETISAKLEQNLEEIFGSQPWLDEPDDEKIRTSLIDMPVLAGGRVFIGHEGDELKNRATGEVSVLEADVTSFVVKRGGWVVNLEAASPSVYAAAMKALDGTGAA